MTAAAFSADGSVLAVAAETIITLWDPQKNFLVATIGKTLSVNVLIPMLIFYVFVYVRQAEVCAFLGVCVCVFEKLVLNPYIRLAEVCVFLGVVYIYIF